MDAEIAPIYEGGLQLRQLQKQIQSVRGKLLELESLLLFTSFDGNFQLNLNKIRHIKAQVEEEKETLSQITADIQRCVTKHPNADDSSRSDLKEDIAGLYQMWERIACKVSDKEALLVDGEKTWKEFQEQLLNLKAEIATDQNRIKSYIEFQSGHQSTPDATLESFQSKKNLIDINNNI